MKAALRLLSLAAALAALPLAAQQSVDMSAPPGASPDQGPQFEPHEVHGPEGLKPTPSPFVSGKPIPFYDKLDGSPPPAPISPEQVEQMQKFMDNQKNWTMLTPEEIMGIPDERAIFGLPESDDEKNLTVEQRYMKRLEAQDQAAATNSPNQNDSSALGEDQENAKDSSQDGIFGPKSAKVLTDIWGRKMNADGTSDMEQQRDSIWDSAFAHPAALPKPDAQQQAEMDQFRALLGSIEPQKPVQPVQTLQPVAPAPDPNMQQLPVFNPDGNSFTEIRQTSYKPNGIMPLPGITTRHLDEKKKPESITKLPPWLSNQTPNPAAVQRVF